MTESEQLLEIGLGAQEAKLYLAALELSPASVAQLSKKAGIERTASYPHLEELVRLGLLSIKPERGRRLYVAENPRKIGEILDNKKATFSKILPELMSVFNVKGVKPKVRYYEGRDGMRTILMNSIAGAHKIKFHLNPLRNVLEILGEEFARKYIETRAARGIKVNALRVRDYVEGPWEINAKDASLLREIRYLPDDFALEDMIIIYANTVAIISSVKENYGLEIESKELADTMRSFFNMAWDAAGEV